MELIWGDFGGTTGSFSPSNDTGVRLTLLEWHCWQCYEDLTAANIPGCEACNISSLSTLNRRTRQVKRSSVALHVAWISAQNVLLALCHTVCWQLSSAAALSAMHDAHNPTKLLDKSPKEHELWRIPAMSSPVYMTQYHLSAARQRTILCAPLLQHLKWLTTTFPTTSQSEPVESFLLVLSDTLFFLETMQGSGAPCGEWCRS